MLFVLPDHQGHWSESASSSLAVHLTHQLNSIAWYAGRGTRGGRGRGGRAGGRTIVFDDPEDIEFMRALKGHSKQINALAVDHSTQQACLFGLADDFRCLHEAACGHVGM